MSDDVKVTVLQVDTNCRPTKKGDPQVGIRTKTGWVKVSSDDNALLRDIRAGMDIVISQPAEFGKSFYARLKQIPPQAKQEPPKQEAQAASDSPPRLTLSQLTTVMQRVCRALPEAWMGDVNGARAQATVVNTVLMAVCRGEVVIDDSVNDAYAGMPDAGPMPDDDGAPWGKS